MIQAVRHPTIKSLLALTTYVAMLCLFHRCGAYDRNQDRDAWLTLPFALLPFCVPLVVRSKTRNFWGCYAVFAVYATTRCVFEDSWFFDVNFLHYPAKAVSLLPDWILLSDSLWTEFLLILLVSTAYGATSLLAAATYRLPSRLADGPSAQQSRASSAFPASRP